MNGDNLMCGWWFLVEGMDLWWFGQVNGVGDDSLYIYIFSD